MFGWFRKRKERKLEQEDPLGYWLGQLKCPDCKSPILPGPGGGMSMNVRCSNDECGHEFCTTIMGPGQAIFSERLDRDARHYYGNKPLTWETA